MPTQPTNPTPEPDEATPPKEAVNDANEHAFAPDPEPTGDQDIDTAGTDADPESPTKAMGTGIAPDRSRG